MLSVKPAIAGVACALVVQYPIALAFQIISITNGSSSILRALEFVTVYFFLVTVIALPIIVVLGIPAFILLQQRKIDSNRNMMITGGLIALVLATALTWPGHLGSGNSAGQNYYGTYRDMIVDGVPTIWGWTRFVENLVMFAIHGAIGAAGFRLGWLKFGRKNVDTKLKL